jgi:DNA-binding NarL/FixJ family response regulator
VAEPLRLLVADDHPLMRDGVVHSLQVQPGWQVVAQADNCEQALAMARRTRPDVVQRVAEGESYVPPALAGRVLGEFARARSDQAAAALTAREAEVLELLAQGLTNREIGLQLHLAEKTVKHHVTQVLNKLHVRSRTVAALLAQRRGRRGL